MKSKMNALLVKFLHGLEASLQYIAIATMLAGVSLPFIFIEKDRQARIEAIAYFCSSYMLAIVAGLIAKDTPMLTEFDQLISATAYVVGPTTYSLIRNKSIFEVLRIYAKSKEGEQLETHILASNPYKEVGEREEPHDQNG